MDHRGGKRIIQRDVVTNSDKHFIDKVTSAAQPVQEFQFYSLFTMSRLKLDWKIVGSSKRRRIVDVQAGFFSPWGFGHCRRSRAEVSPELQGATQAGSLWSLDICRRSGHRICLRAQPRVSTLIFVHIPEEPGKLGKRRLIGRKKQAGSLCYI